jgi:hypothetical protein
MRESINNVIVLFGILFGAVACAHIDETPEKLVRCGWARSIARCVTVPLADENLEASVRKYEKKPDIAGVYIFRAQIVGSKTRIPILLDGKILGETAPRTFAYVEVTPGKHILSDVSDMERSIQIDTRGGMLYFVAEKIISYKPVVRSQLMVVEEEDGKAGVAYSHLIRMQPADKD